MIPRRAALTLVAVAVISITGHACTAAPPAAEAPNAAWGSTSVVEELAIGVDIGPEEYMFGGIRDMAVGPDGTIFVSAIEPALIRQYDAEGNFVRDIGRQGQGPGEYQSPALGVLADGRLAVWDFRANRLSLFSRDGDYEESVTAESNIGGSEALHIDAGGSFHVLARAGFAEVAGQMTELHEYSLNGTLLGRVAIPAPDPAGAAFTLSFEGLQPFTTRTLWAWSPLGYMVVGRNDRYDIELRDPAGVVHLSRDIEPVALAAGEHAEWDAFRDRFLFLNRDRSIPVESDPIPSQKPYFRSIHAADDGRIWVWRYVAAVEREDILPRPEAPERPLLTWREPPTYDVFEADGTFLGSVVLPNDFAPHVFRGERIWGLHTDEDGVERVKRLRVETSG